MSDDQKKPPNKQSFFRINTKGELSSADEKGPPKVEPKEIDISEDKSLRFKDSPTEVKTKEPFLSFSGNNNESDQNTTPQSNLEPNVMDGPSFQNPTHTEALVFNSAEIPESSLIDDEPEKKESSIASSEWQLPDSLKGPAVINTSPLQPSSQPGQQSPSDDSNLDTLKNYISLKEKEVSDLKEQQKQYQSLLLKLKRNHSELSVKNIELGRELETALSNERLIKNELVSLREQQANELDLLKNDLEEDKKKSGLFQEKLQELNRQKAIWKEKITDDLKKIKLKEKEIENRYELLKKDTEILLDSKDNQMLEHQKKTDAQELELESLEERLRSGHAVINAIGSKKRRLIETLKLAISLLEQIDSDTDSNEQRKTG